MTNSTIGTAALVICKEVFDDGCQPSTEEINDYALRIGIDPEHEPHLLYLAKEGLMHALPPDWKVCYDDKFQAHYYYNEKYKITQWDHPLDAVYRDFVEKARLKHSSALSNNSIIATKNVDVSEDVSQIDSGIKSLQCNEDSEINTNDTGSTSTTINIKMNPIPKENNRVETVSNRFIIKSQNGQETIRTSRFEVVKTNPQIGLDMRFNVNDPIGLDRSFRSNWKSDETNNEKKGFTICGTGSMFLKSNTKKTAESSLMQSNDSNSLNNSIGGGMATKPIDIDRTKSYFSEIINSNVKGILRDTSLTDVRRRFDDTETEDKKSVRFNLDEIKLRSNYSPEEDPSSSRKFGQSPDVSDQSDDDDPWDFMENIDNENENVVEEVTPNQNDYDEVEPEADGDDEVDAQEEEKHIKEIKVVPAFKPVLKVQHSSDEILNKPQKKLIGLDRTFSADNAVEKSNTSILDKIKEQNLVKPLYEDTDSDSRGSSVTSFIQRTTNDNENINNDYDEMMREHSVRLEEIRQKLAAEALEEEKRLREELEQDLNRKKEDILQSHERELAALKVEQSKIEICEDIEKTFAEEKEKIDNEMQERIEKYRLEKADELNRQMEVEKQRLEEELQKTIEGIEVKHKEKIDQIQQEYDTILEEVKTNLEEEQNKELEDFRTSLQKEFDSKRKKILDEHKASVDVLQRNHAEIVQDLERDLKSEEEILKKEHMTNLAQMRDKLAHELEMERHRMRESGEDRLYEKIRCEKRLLEDKYRCLKEKYIRLKTDVKLSLERRNRRREQQSTQPQSLTTTTTGSETERSTSNKPSIGNSENRSASISTAFATGVEHGKPPVTPKNQLISKDRDKSIETQHSQSLPSQQPQTRDRKLGIASKYIKQLQAQYQEDTTSISQSDTTISNNYTKGKYLPTPYSDNGNSDSEAFRRNQENNNNPRDRQRKKLFSRMKSASTSRLNSENFKVDRPCTPVENLRRQLQKLEDLEDQFPDNTLDTTYHLRYPFSDISNDRAGTSSELEFFKHRIHLERDSVRRAKESLRTQRTNFRARQREIKQRHKSNNTRHSLDQLIQEEKELTEMEVNLHRTRALLGEKVIRLRHLEQSLQRIYEKERPMDLLHVENKDDATLSDLSSHSSSGFSSTDFASDTNQANVNRRKEMYQESSECIQNLEILNAEIREILDILSKQQSHGIQASTQVTYPELNWSSMVSPSVNNTQPSNNPSSFLHAPQSIPTLADRLETYRQLAAGRVQTSVGGAIMAANTIVSQNPRAVNYTTSLVERTRDLRNWLRQAKNEHDILSSANISANVGTNTGQQTNL